MPYSELAYFDGNHCAHCATRDEHKRLAGIRKRAFQHIERERRATPRARFN